MLTLENIARLRAIAKADTNGADGKTWDEAVTPEVVIALCDKVEQARALMWVNKPPKVPGWYWFRNVSKPTILHIKRVSMERKPHPADEWTGPIPEPREPK